MIWDECPIRALARADISGNTTSLSMMLEPIQRITKSLVLLSCAALATLFLGIAEAAPGVRAELNRQSVPAGESVTLSLIFEGLPQAASPNLPAIPNVNVTGVSQRSEFVFDNGVSTSRQVFEYNLVPAQPGDVAIPPMQIQVQGQTFRTQPLSLKVLPATAPQADAGATNLAFLRLVTPKSEVYLGEAFPVEIDLYWQNAQDVQMPQLKAEGFTLGQPAKPLQTGTTVGGAHYNLAVFKMAATAAKPGLLTLGPAECSLTILIPVGGPRRRDVFDPFGMFGPRMQGRPTVLQSDPQQVRVLPLPKDNVPETFNGAVGTYNLAVTAGPTNLAVGDPLTVRVQISGRGLLDAVSLPPQQQWRDFKAYDANSKTESNDPLGLAGTKTFEQVIIPQNHEISRLPPLQFSYFDPNSRRYQTLSGPAIPLTVRPSASASAPSLPTNSAPANAPPPPSDDIVHIRARLDPVAMAQPPLIQRRWFLGLQALPIVAWVALFVTRRRREALANNPRLRRQREVAHRVREGLRELPALAAAEKSEAFFALVFRLLQEQLGERLDQPASGITEAVIEERLRGRNLSEATLKELHELFQACNQARYAPHRSSEELTSYIPRLENVLRHLQQLKA